jgi:hypothetical protein
LTSQHHGIGPEGESPGLKLPPFPPNVWRGVFKQYRELVQDREGSDVFDFIAFAAAVGIRLGRRAYLPYERPLYPNLYAVLYGPTTMTRKTSAARRACHLVLGTDSEVELLTEISSAEGLIERLGGPPTADPKPRRVIVVLEEFLGLLTKSRQERSNKIASVVTQLYDCPDKYTLPTRQVPILAVKPTLGIIGCTTKEWLERGLGHEDIMGGFANRFAYATGAPRPLNPLPALPDEALADKIRLSISVAEEHLPDHHRIGLSPAARKIWEAFYYDWHDRQWPSETLAIMVRRVLEHILKVALIFAALEQAQEVTSAMMEAAIAFGEYEAVCVTSLFTGFREEHDAKIEAKIEAILAAEQQIHMSKLHQRISGRVTAAKLRTITGGLVSVGKARYLAKRKILALPNQ